MPGQNFAEIEWSSRRLENFLIHHPYISQRSKITPMIRILHLKNEKKKKKYFVFYLLHTMILGYGVFKRGKS